MHRSPARLPHHRVDQSLKEQLQRLHTLGVPRGLGGGKENAHQAGEHLQAVPGLRFSGGAGGGLRWKAPQAEEAASRVSGASRGATTADVALEEEFIVGRG